MNAFSPPAIGSVSRPDFLAFINDAETENMVASLVQDYWPRGVVIQGGVFAALNANPSATGMPQFVVVDVSDSDRPDTDVERIVKIFSGAKAVVFVGERNDATLYRQVLKAGGADYLVKPVDAGELYSTLINASIASSPAADPSMGYAAMPSRKAKIVTVLGVHGGVGTSTVAVNAAYEMAEAFNHTVAIIDLDVHFGTVALSLNKEPSIGFRDALETPGRIDTVFIESALVSVTNRLSVLATEEKLDDYINYNTAAIDLLVDKVRDNREYVFLDTPRTMIIRFPQLVTEASHVILVSDLTIVGLRDAVTLLEKLRNIAPGKEIKLVLNRVRARPEGQVALRDFEAEIGRPVNAVLPDAPETVARALNEGKPVSVLAPASKFIAELRHFCAEMDGSEAAPGGATGIKKFLGMLKK